MARRLSASCGLVIAAVLGVGCAVTPRSGVAPNTVPTSMSATTRPTLLVFLTVDQLRPDYFERFHAQLDGGLGWLYKHGAVFTSAYQDHANTETAPGHAATLSGRFPSHTGIIVNDVGVPDANAPLVGGGGPGASPFRFQGTTLVDWLRSADPRSRALSVSRKDRGAILPIGRSKQSVFWYASDGRFTTSTYYAENLPAWVRSFNDRRIPQLAAGREWTMLAPSASYSEPDSVPIESNGRDYLFPHRLSSDTASATRDLIAFPWMDELTLDFALAGAVAMHLGEGLQTDVLAISLSTTDAVGHRFGPDSRELHDQILRLDRSLGRFLDSLFKLRDSSRVIIALTADHGVTPYPELAPKSAAGQPARVDLNQVEAEFDSSLTARHVARDAFALDGGMVVVNRKAFAAAKVDLDSALGVLASRIRGQPGVQRVDFVRDLTRADTTTDVMARRWVHALPEHSNVEMVITLQPYSVWAGPIAQHGSGSDLDAHVPLIFWGRPFRPGRYDQFARVVDIAPTLARTLGVAPAERIDGHVLTSALR
jgi:arylsulfatase A-like enzyme